MTDALRILVSGQIAQYPLGGVAWDYLQYPVGLARLGHDVIYVEDSGQWPYHPGLKERTDDCSYNVAHLESVFARFGLEDRWAYRCPATNEWAGTDRETLERFAADADMLLNVSGTLRAPEDFANNGVRVFIDSDPVFTQVKLAAGHDYLQQQIATHDVVFSFGERLFDEPSSGEFTWLPTRQPVLLDEWNHDTSHRDVFTTVMTWSSYKPVVHEGVAYGQKDLELRRFLDMPSAAAPARFEIAFNKGKSGDSPRPLLREHGWTLVDPSDVCPDIERYRWYIQTSKAEWSIAKNGYVVGRPGWFSCRSACYLAAGRPVVVQDTGFRDILPVGEGLFAFDDLDESVAAVREVEARYDRHSRAAREIAQEYFDARTVLGDLVERAMRPENQRTRT